MAVVKASEFSEHEVSVLLDCLDKGKASLMSMQSRNKSPQFAAVFKQSLIDIEAVKAKLVSRSVLG